MYDRVPGACQDVGVIDHFGINCRDWARSKEFYDVVFHGVAPA